MQTETIRNVTITNSRNTEPSSQHQPLKPDAKTPEKPKEKTPEEKKLWQEGRDKAFSRMFPNAKKEGDEAPAKGAAKAKETKAATTTEKETSNGKATGQTTGQTVAGKKVDAEQAEEQPKPKAAKEAPAVDYEKLATSVATATAKALKAEEKPKETVKPEDEVPEGRRRDLPAIDFLDKNNPRYKGKLDEYKRFSKAEADYVAKWEKENQGLKFDPDAEEHEAWYDKHEPDIDPEDINEARIELAAERRAKSIVEKETGSTRQKIDALELERDIERADRHTPAFINRNIALVGSSMGEDVANAFAGLKDGASLEDTDPAAHMTLMQVLPELNKQTEAASRIFGTNGRAYNGQDQVHQEVARAALELEALILSQPEEKLKDQQGRTFAKLDQWAAMNDAEKAKHWTIGADLMSAHLGNKAAEKAAATYKSEREKAEKIAKAYGYSKNGAPITARTERVVEHEETETEHAKYRSPSTATRTVIQPGKKVETQNSKDGGTRMLDRMFHR